MKNIVKRYDDGFLAVNDVSLEVADGEFVILVGPSGCGKSTLLNMIVGLEDITSGDMLIDGDRVNEKKPRDRNLAMVFQNYALYPHLSVFENIAFPLRLAKQFSEEEIDRKVRGASKTLELDEHLDRPRPDRARRVVLLHRLLAVPVPRDRHHGGLGGRHHPGRHHRAGVPASDRGRSDRRRRQGLS